MTFTQEELLQGLVDLTNAHMRKDYSSLEPDAGFRSKLYEYASDLMLNQIARISVRAYAADLTNYAVRREAYLALTEKQRKAIGLDEPCIPPIPPAVENLRTKIYEVRLSDLAALKTDELLQLSAQQMAAMADAYTASIPAEPPAGIEDWTETPPAPPSVFVPHLIGQINY